MTAIRDVRAGLRHYESGDSILVAWWDKDWFETALGIKLTDEQYAEIIGECENTIEYSNLADMLTNTAHDVVEGYRK